jgi:hypothetical protein
VSFGNWTNRQKQLKAAVNADQVEVAALRAGVSQIDAGLLDERIAGVIDDELIERGNSWAERQAVLETLSGEIAEELQRRSSLMQKAYPFQIAPSGAVEYVGSKSCVYEFCLAVSRSPTAEIQGTLKASAIFEFIARDVVAAYFGNDSRGFRTGAPPYEVEGRGNSARETFQELTKRCGEFTWNPAQNYPSNPNYRDLKDIGVDVVVWKEWPDKRLGQLFAIGQCACGKNDIDATKARELSLERLGNWLRPICYAHPVRCFILAHHVPNTPLLYELSKEGGLVFDRARLTLLAEQFPEAVALPDQMDLRSAAERYISFGAE